jgi:hypothetical protein
MTSHVTRLYVLVGATLVFFLAWAAIAARPWASEAKAPPDARVALLAAREKQLRHEAELVRKVLAHRQAVRRAALARRRALAAVAAAAAPAAPATPAPQVRVVTLPPVTSTRTS